MADTVVLVTVVGMDGGSEKDFFPLPSTIKNVTMPLDAFQVATSSVKVVQVKKETLTSRLIDRPLRPLFPKGFNCETQVIATVMS